MKEESRQILLEAIARHPEIVSAAITGSLARPGGEDRLSDLDLLPVAQDLPEVANVRS
jgi:predicted nucleotidyltransferase